MTRPPLLRALNWLGLVLLVALITIAGPRRMLALAAQLDPWWLLAGFALNVPQLGLKALRWHILLRWQKIDFSFGRAFLAYFSALLVGFLTPGRLGEAVKAFTLRNEAGVPLALGFSSVVLDRAFDMYLLLTLGTLGLVRFAVVGEALSWPAFMASCALLLVPLVFLHERVFRATAGLAVRLGPLRPRAEQITQQADRFAGGLAVLTPLRLLTCVLLTIAAYLIFFVQCLFCAFALGFTLPFRDLVLMMSASNFISFLPITQGGLGTREYVLTLLLARTVPPQPDYVAVSFGLTIFLVLFVGGGLIGWVCWQWAPMGLRRAADEARAARRRGGMGRG